MTTPLAGNASLRDALVAAVERSGKLDMLILAPRPREKRPADQRRHGRRKAAASLTEYAAKKAVAQA